MQRCYHQKMRTTIDIDEPLLRRAKALAAKSGRRLADVVNDALAEVLARVDAAESNADPIVLPTFGAGGVCPGVDPRSNASLFEAADETVS